LGATGIEISIIGPRASGTIPFTFPSVSAISPAAFAPSA
jgi:hypothetical protein